MIREVRQWSQVPIIVLSAREREAEKIEALDLGADDFVNKPFGVGELRHDCGQRCAFAANRKAKRPSPASARWRSTLSAEERRAPASK